jgi:hypothetical protein
VTLSREYAEAHLESNLGDAGHIIEAEVLADTLRFAGDDLMEWGYWGPSIKGTPVRRPTRRRRNPSEDITDRYGHGECHVLTLALADTYSDGKPYVVELDPYWSGGDASIVHSMFKMADGTWVDAYGVEPLKAKMARWAFLVPEGKNLRLAFSVLPATKSDLQNLSGRKGLKQRVAEAKEAVREVVGIRANPRRRNPAPTSDASARADAFREWFRNSKIVDENGEPLVVYHGGFDVLNSRNGTFRKSKTGSLGSGIYFTPDRSAAEYYMAPRGGYEAVENGVITEAYLSVQNPLVVRPTHDEDPTVEALVLLGESRDRAYDKVEKIRERFGDMGATLPNAARAAGYDGIIRIGWRDGKVAEIVVFEPWQVKSATRNAGTYYPYGSDIRTNPARSSSASGGRTPMRVR